jgi:hypothetical protein
MGSFQHRSLNVIRSLRETRRQRCRTSANGKPGSLNQPCCQVRNNRTPSMRVWDAISASDAAIIRLGELAFVTDRYEAISRNDVRQSAGVIRNDFQSP